MHGEVVTHSMGSCGLHDGLWFEGTIRMSFITALQGYSTAARVRVVSIYSTAERDAQT